MRTAAAAAALGLTLLTAGLASCADPGGPPLVPPPAPSSTPVFASDEEALAAAEEAYARYLEVSNSVGAGGWVDTDPLASVERGAALEDDLATAKGFRERDLRQVGETMFDTVTLQSYSAESHETTAITVYLCLDVADVDLVDADGASVVGSDRPDRQAVEVDIDDYDGSFKVSRSDAWSHASFC